jgi:hypothetical protein
LGSAGDWASERTNERGRKEGKKEGEAAFLFRASEVKEEEEEEEEVSHTHKDVPETFSAAKSRKHRGQALNARAGAVGRHKPTFTAGHICKCCGTADMWRAFVRAILPWLIACLQNGVQASIKFDPFRFVSLN